MLKCRFSSTKKCRYAGGQIDTLNSNPNVVPVNATDAEVVVYTGPRLQTLWSVCLYCYLMCSNKNGLRQSEQLFISPSLKLW